ncbi:MAG: TonB-dependent receptor plug domain-containing protein [Elusimicrobiales bacterium]
MRPLKLSLFLSVLLAAPALARAGLSNEDEFFSLERASLEEVLNLHTSVATRSGMSLRETPGLVTVITREEIQASGARSLVDVLSLIPEFEFAMDVQGVLGLGVRGVWGHEGKVLVMWDGQVYNETLYSTVQFARFPVDQVEEIAIIKGPGSSVYGGFAELAVIDIKTRSARSLHGSEAYAAFGAGGSAARYAGYSFGKTFSAGEISAKVFTGSSRRGDRLYTDFNGASYDMAGNSDLRPQNLSLQASYGVTTAKLILDNFYLRQRDGFDALISTGDTRVSFPAVFAELRQNVSLSDRVAVEPKLTYTRSRAWHEDDAYFPYHKTAERVTAGFTAFYKHDSRANFMAGGEYYHDNAQIDPATGDASARDINGVRLAGSGYENHAFFGQGTLDLGFALATAGARYDKHSRYGSSLVPRLAFTTLVSDFNFKAIFSQAFRAPSIENIRLSTSIAPEKATSMEVEIGYKTSETLFISANAFHTTIKRPIVFESSVGEHYRNYGRTGTMGGGAALKYKREDFRADLSYLYQETQCNDVPAYAVPGRSSYMLAFPRHKVTLNSSLFLAPGLSVNPSAFYVSRRYGYAGANNIRAFGETAVANINLRLADRPLQGLTLNLGVRDIFNSGYSYIQPYDSGHAPLPAPSRELFIKAAYEF